MAVFKPIRYSDAELMEFKTIINKQLALLAVVLKFHEKQHQENPDDLETIAKMAVQRYTMVELEEALQRIQNRRFGICEETRQLMDKTLLKMFPYAKTNREVLLLSGRKT